MSKMAVVLAAIALAALASCGGGKSTGGSQHSAAPPSGAVDGSTRPNCGGQSAVWAIQGAKVYLLPGDRLYGKTKGGEYLCLAEAHAQGYRAARRPFRPAHR
jgi:hypothetical protein